jgi:hypothetical protein
MRSLKLVRLLLLVLTLAFVGAVAGYYMTLKKVQAAPLTVTPFRAELWGYVPDAAGNLTTLRHRHIIARRSDGSSVRASTYGDPHLGNFSRRIEYADGSFSHVVDDLRMKVTGRHTALELARIKSGQAAPPADCRFQKSETLLGEETLGGERVLAVRTLFGDARSTVYYRAPALGCVDLALRKEEKQSDGSVRADVEYRLVSLTRAEPEPILFQAGSDYVERLPSEIEQEYERKASIPPCQNCGASRASRDQWYKEHR